MDQPTVQQHREPGVKYKPVTRHRMVTTEINGIASTREVPYESWEPVPPKEWDEVILRGATGVILGFAGIAAIGTSASVGGLLATLVVEPIAYMCGVMFTGAWLTCVAFQWLDRVDPERARVAERAGWFFLALSMGATVAYGHTLNALWAGIVGAAIDLIAKGLLLLLIRYHRVPLDADLAHWVTEREQAIASKSLLGKRIARLNRMAAYQRAVGGREYEAASAMLDGATVTRTVVEDTAASSPELGPVIQAVPVQAAPPVPAAPAPVVVPVAPTASAVPVVPAAPAPVVAPAAPVVPNYIAAPVPTVPVAPVVPSVPVTSQTAPQAPAAAAPATGGGTAAQSPVPAVTPIGRPNIATICRAGIAANAKVTDAELLAMVLAAGHEDRPTLADTVRRSAQRIDPDRKAS
ncbi:hypothetical protein OV450_1422 [Actinobacteria bacterium OV450]|nr:hypothetical protein OV450_1422 [Actinobacteria bacterium OV450]